MVLIRVGLRFWRYKKITNVIEVMLK